MKIPGIVIPVPGFRIADRTDDILTLIISQRLRRDPHEMCHRSNAVFLVHPFFLSNLIANIYGFYQNKKTTFKSDAPWYNFAIYIVLMIALILFSTWFQGWLVGIIAKAPWAWLNGLARTIAGLAAGFVQMVVLFPMEKFVLLKEKKEEKEA